MDIKLKIQYYLQLQKNKIWDLYAENYKMLMKEINEDLKKKMERLCSWIGRLSIIKMSVLPKLICRFNEIPFKITAGFGFCF